MKKINKVFNQLSKLYEFNKQLQTYSFLKTKALKGQQNSAANSSKRGGFKNKVDSGKVL